MRAPEQDWAVVVPVKGGPLAKSRLHLPRAARAALADAFARDTVAALAAGMPGAPVLVVTSDPDVARWVAAAGHVVVADPGGRARRGRRRRGGCRPRGRGGPGRRRAR